MSYLQGPPGEPEPDTSADTSADTGADTIVHTETEDTESPVRSVGARLSTFRERVTRAFLGLEHPELDQPALLAGDGPESVGEETQAFDVLAEVSPPSQDAHFPVGALGYNRGAVDDRIAELERELEELRQHTEPAISITDEIERLGEQTASILVVAHDKAHETTRLAQEQADRCIADAASNAVAITAEAKQQLRELDNETDAIWRERTRLLDDARSVGLALIALAEEAQERFPGEQQPVAEEPVVDDQATIPAPVPADGDF
jgi:DivIVA protein